ncbi:MAG: IS701 family transposase [Chloroflexaceae bacterium]
MRRIVSRTTSRSFFSIGFGDVLGGEYIETFLDNSGQPGTIANGQAGIFVADASPHGMMLRDRRLDLPRAWVEDTAVAERRAKCRIPIDGTFQTRNKLALAMVQAVVTSQALRCCRVLADEAFGPDTGLIGCDRRGGAVVPVVEVPLDTAIWPDEAPAATTPQRQCRSLPATAWIRHPLGDGTKGRHIVDAVGSRVRAQRDGQPGPDVWLILRRDPETGEQTAFRSNAPASLTPARVVAVSGVRWPIEQGCDVANQELGMGDDDVCRWTGWHQHTTLVILAHVFLVRLQRRLITSLRC